MNIQIYAKNIEVTPALSEHINKYADKMNNKLIHDRGTVKTVVTMKVENDKHICEVAVFFPKHTFIKTSSSSSMYDSIKESFDCVSRDIRRSKEKNMDKRHDFIKDVFEEVETVEEIN